MYSCLLVVLAVTGDVTGYWWKGYSSDCDLTIKCVKFTIWYNLEIFCKIFLYSLKILYWDKKKIFFQSFQTLEGGTEPSFNNVYGKLFPQNESRPTYSWSTQERGYDKLQYSDTLVVLDLLVANGADVKRTSQETVGIWSNSIVANESQGHCWLTFSPFESLKNLI